MAMPGQDPLFYRPGSPAVFLQHPFIVVGFDNQGIHLPDALQREFGRVAKVSQEPNGARVRSEDEGCRIDSIMRYVKTLYLDIFHRENGSGCEQVPVRKTGQRSPA